MSTDFTALQQRAKRRERIVWICVAGDLIAEFEDLERQLKDAQKAYDPATATIESGPPGRETVEQMEALQERMRADTYPFRLRALPRPGWKALLAAHPPRKAGEDSNELDERDKYLLLNTDTFFDALIRVSVVDPVLDEAGWKQLLDEDLTDAQVDSLSNAAWALNRSTVDVPFSHAASRTTRSAGTE